MYQLVFANKLGRSRELGKTQIIGELLTEFGPGRPRAVGGPWATGHTVGRAAGGLRALKHL